MAPFSVMIDKNERRWYVVQTYAGYENKVKANLEQRIATMGMEDKIFRVLVPIEDEFTLRTESKESEKKSLSGVYTCGNDP